MTDDRPAPDRVAIASIERHQDGRSRTDQDLVAVEAPLTIRISHLEWPMPRPLGVLMRTPGDDHDLVTGLLYAEGVIARAVDVGSWTWSHDGDEMVGVEVALAAHVDARADAGLARALVTTSACGLCGRLDAPHVARAGAPDETPLSASIVEAIPDALRARQAVFAETGGLHAAAMIDSSGAVVLVREDVGRHNAVDKLVGAWITSGGGLASDHTLAVSGRVAFEIVQKAARAGFRSVVSVGAPSSLAVDAARAAGLTLVGFAREGRFNVYAGRVGLR